MPCPDEEKDLETLKVSGATVEGAPTVGQAWDHTFPTILSFDPYSDLRREESLSPFHRAGD